ncbi:6-carboxytetrahydropterin synthase QueD [Thermoproteota archaeon]
MLLTKEFTFDSAHKLSWHTGKCKDMHGHSYKLQVTVSGELDENGIVIDFGDMKKIVSEKVLVFLDHKNLNDVLDNPTAENIAVWIWNKLKSELDLHEIKLWETATSFVTYRG